MEGPGLPLLSAASGGVFSQFYGFATGIAKKNKHQS